MQLEASALTDEEVQGKVGLPSQLGHVEFEVLLGHVGGVGW